MYFSFISVDGFEFKFSLLRNKNFIVGASILFLVSKTLLTSAKKTDELQKISFIFIQIQLLKFSDNTKQESFILGTTRQ